MQQIHVQQITEIKENGSLDPFKGCLFLVLVVGFQAESKLKNRTIELTDDRPRHDTNQKLSERILSTGTNVPFSTF